MSTDGVEEFVELAGTAAKSRSNRINKEVPIPAEAATMSGASGQPFNKKQEGYLQGYEVHGSVYFPCGKTVETMPAGQYRIDVSDRGIFFVKMRTNLDELLVLPDNNCDKVLASIEKFWDREKAFREFKFLWKRGIMLWGPPGSGKTSLLQLLSKDIIERDGLTIYIENPKVSTRALEMFREVEPDRPVVVILEDIDAMVKSYGDDMLLALLDGEVQIDNVVYVATTNYPELLDPRLVNRPSRFDEVIKIGMPTAAARKVYLERKNPKLDPEQLAYWVKHTDGFSVAHLRELIVSVECLGNDVDATIKRLKIMNEKKSSSADFERKLGFTADI